jgi:hypothetical protein
MALPALFRAPPVKYRPIVGQHQGMQIMESISGSGQLQSWPLAILARAIISPVLPVIKTRREAALTIQEHTPEGIILYHGQRPTQSHHASRHRFHLPVSYLLNLRQHTFPYVSA